VQPVGRFEELLVDKLASLSWRYRRFLLAETGEIRRQFLEWSEDRSKEKDQIADSLREDDCLGSNLHNSDALKRCLELLGELREGIKTTGFSQNATLPFWKRFMVATLTRPLDSKVNIQFGLTQQYQGC